MNTSGYILPDTDPEGIPLYGVYPEGTYVNMSPQYHSIGCANGVILSLFFAIFRRVSHSFVLLLASRKMPKVIKVSFKVCRRFLPRRLDWNTYALSEGHGVDG